MNDLNNIEQYIKDNPVVISEFMNGNRELLLEIKKRFEDFLESGDLISRYLLAQALLQILKTATEKSKELLSAELAVAGINITDSGGSC